MKNLNDSIFAPNESIRRVSILSYSEIEVALLHKKVENFNDYESLPKEDKEIMEAFICAEKQITLKNKSGLNTAKRTLLRCIAHN